MGFVRNIVDECGPVQAAEQSSAPGSAAGGATLRPSHVPSSAASFLASSAASPPLYYEVSTLCSRVKCTSMPLPSMYNALVNAGYKALPTHCAPNSVKTDAPPVVIHDIIRAWAVKQGKRAGEGSTGHTAVLAYLQDRGHSTAGVGTVPEDAVAARAPLWAEALRSVPIHEAILSVAQQSPSHLLPAPISFEGNATCSSKEHRKAGGARAPRYVPNPQANWGPKARATGLSAEQKVEAAETSAAAVQEESIGEVSSSTASKKAKLQTWGEN